MRRLPAILAVIIGVLDVVLVAGILFLFLQGQGVKTTVTEESAAQDNSEQYYEQDFTVQYNDVITAESETGIKKTTTVTPTPTPAEENNTESTQDQNTDINQATDQNTDQATQTTPDTSEYDQQVEELEEQLGDSGSSSRLHKRCGTSFLFFVVIVSAVLLMLVQVDSHLLRILWRIILIPVIAGISFEFIRIAGSSDSAFANAMSKPGLALQKLTTREPNARQAEVAIKAVEAVFDWRAYLAENFGYEYDAEAEQAGNNVAGSDADV